MGCGQWYGALFTSPCLIPISTGHFSSTNLGKFHFNLQSCLFCLSRISALLMQYSSTNHRMLKFSQFNGFSARLNLPLFAARLSFLVHRESKERVHRCFCQCSFVAFPATYPSPPHFTSGSYIQLCASFPYINIVFFSPLKRARASLQSGPAILNKNCFH